MAARAITISIQKASNISTRQFVRPVIGSILRARYATGPPNLELPISYGRIGMQCDTWTRWRNIGPTIDASLISVIDRRRRFGNPIHGAVTEVVSLRTVVPPLTTHSVGDCISPFVGYTNHLKYLCHAPLADTEHARA